MKSLFVLALSLVFLLVAMLALPAQAQNFKVLYSFAGGEDGSAPRGWLVRDGNGNLFGVTSEGGGTFPHCQSGFGCGTIFVVTPSGQEGVMHRFTDNTDGGYPFAGLVLGSDGNLYGTTSQGFGSVFVGTVYQIDPRNSKMTVIYGFADGGAVFSGVIRDSGGNLYGTTQGGGNRTAPFCQLNGCGVVYKVDQSGNESVLHTFTGPPDGWWPAGSLVSDGQGNLYGITAAGDTSNCDSGCGTIFRIDTQGNETILHSFAGQAEGNDPQAALIQDGKGNLYGTNYAGGTFGFGTVYKLDALNNFTVLHSFTGRDGANPAAALVRDSTGNLYGTTYAGGDSSCGYMGSGCGVVFRLGTNGTYSVLHAFSGLSDGASPTSSLILDRSGNLYGSASSGGMLTQGVSNGVVFEISRE